jgi:hypothetical protein
MYRDVGHTLPLTISILLSEKNSHLRYALSNLLPSPPPQSHIGRHQQIQHLYSIRPDDQFAQFGLFPAKTTSSLLLAKILEYSDIMVIEVVVIVVIVRVVRAS